jgi:hypothetical protein
MNDINFIRIMFYKDGEVVTASKEQKDELKSDQLIQQGYLDLNLRNAEAYINLLLHSDVIEVFDGVYKIKRRQFRAMQPYELSIELGLKIK